MRTKQTLAKGESLTRRNMLRSTAAAMATFSIVPSYLTAAAMDGDRKAPSERINLACIGVGGRARGVIPSLCRGGGAEPVAFCDVDYSLPKGAADNKASRIGPLGLLRIREMADEIGKDVLVVVTQIDRTIYIVWE